jgi:DNA-binding transcriptional LysR family regulator
VEAQKLLVRIEHEVSDERTLRGTFRIGVTELTALTWLTRLIDRIQALHPKLMLEPIVDAGLKLFDGLEDNTIDLAIMPGTFWGERYRTVRVGQVEDLWVASPQLGIPDRPLKPEEFAHYPMLEQSKGAAKNRFYAAWRAEHGFRFNQVFATNSTTVLRELTIGGLGISQLALDYVRTDIEEGRLRIIESDPMPPPMVYSAVYRIDSFSVALARISQLAVETCDFTLRANRS